MGKKRKSQPLDWIVKFYGGQKNKGFLINFIWLRKGRGKKRYTVI